MIRTERPKNPNSREDRAVLRVNDAEMAKLQALADQHAGGNLSAYIRHAALSYDPKRASLLEQFISATRRIVRGSAPEADYQNAQQILSKLEGRV